MNAAPNGTAARVDPLAVASLVTAIVLGWCPLTAFAAIGLGIAAIRRIRANPAARSGTGLALGGLAVATAILLVEAWALGQLQDEIQTSMDAQSVAMVEAALTPIPVEEPAWDARSTRPDPAELEAFARAAAAKLGELGDVSITGRTASGLTDPVISVTFNLSGKSGNGFAVAAFSTEPGTIPPRLLLRSIEVEAGGERWRLPVEEARNPGEDKR